MTSNSLEFSTVPRGRGKRLVRVGPSDFGILAEVKERTGNIEAGFVAAAWAGVRLALPPPGHNTHTLMYPLVEAGGGYNTLEPFHALYMPVVTATRRLWELCGAPPPALPALQAVSLLAGAANIILLYRLVRRATGSASAALGAALILAASANLWSWSLMTTSYTLSTFCLLAAADRLLMRERLDSRDAAMTGLLIGFAAGFDTAAGVAAFPASYELWRRRAPASSPAVVWSVFAAGVSLPILAGLGLLIFRLRAQGWPFAPTVAGFLGSLPHDIVPLWRSLDAAAQIRRWASSTSPLDLPVWACLAVVVWAGRAAKSWSEKALWRLGAALWALITLFFFINDPHNRFIYAGATLLPGLFALAAARAKRPLALCAAAAAGLGLWHKFVPPAYTVDDNLGFAEARFLRERLGREDLLVALSDPDWVFSYAFGGRARVIKLVGIGDGEARFGAEASASGAALERRLDPALCAGRKAVFAADALFRSTRREPKALDAEARTIFAGLSKRYIVDPAWISPRGQHYHPLRPRRCPRGI